MGFRRVKRRLWRRGLFVYRDCVARPNADAVFVLGHQKSGTTAVAALLAHSAGLSYSNDLFVERRETVTSSALLSGRSSVAEIVAKVPSAFAAGVIKDPSLTFVYPAVAEAFPEAQFVFVSRDPRDTIRSMLNRLNVPGSIEHADAERLGQLGFSKAAASSVLNPCLLDIPASHYIEVLAHRCRLAAVQYFDNAAAMTLVRYEDFKAAKQSTIEHLAHQVGLSPTHDIEDRQDCQFQPAGDNGASWLEFFGRRNLERIESICGDMIGRLDYRTGAGPFSCGRGRAPRSPATRFLEREW